MKILISGICGFVGNCLAEGLHDADSTVELYGIDNFSRAGSELNLEPLRARGVRVIRGDIRSIDDVEALPAVDWIIDAAANASVLAGIDGATSSRELLENNLYGTVNLLELAKRFRAGFILLSTSRVYSLKPLAALPTVARHNAFQPDGSASLPTGITVKGVDEQFSTEPPLSLYGVSKLTSELLALEYGETFDLPIWINRCGVLAGAGQFGRPDQGIFAYWINAYLRQQRMRYIGFGGSGHQTRDCFHPRDLVPLLRQQMTSRGDGKPHVINFGGGLANTMSLAQLSAWCAARFGAHEVEPDPAPRRFDVPWLVMDSTLAAKTWGWRPTTNLDSILNEIAAHAESHPDWLKISGAL
ncbi:MAG: NAD-dependent epimerase/dehydratase family protein [Verrucomicrobiota bacterium]|nr:NAD-dependent epimerase/dehydratase family protein [Verrucomicrobiota bacterium]